MHSSSRDREEPIMLARSPSDGTIKCSACKENIPKGERYYLVSAVAEGYHDLVRGGNLCAEHATMQWAHAEDMLHPPTDVGAIIERAKSSMGELALSIDALSASPEFTSFTIIYGADYLRMLANAAEIRFRKAAAEYAASGMHDAAAKLTEDAAKRFDGSIKKMGDLIKSSAFPSDFMNQLKEVAENDLHALAFKLCISSAGEYCDVASQDHSANASRMLRDAYAHFSTIQRTGNTWVLCDAFSTELLLNAGRKMLGTGGGDAAVRTMLKDMAVHTYETVVHAPLRYSKDIYHTLGALLEAAGEAAQSKRCYTAFAMRMMVEADILLAKAEFTESDKVAALQRASEAEQMTRKALEIWTEKAAGSDLFSQEAYNRALAGFGELLEKCARLKDALTKNNRALIRDGSE